jgi:hypothetical protein
MFYFFADLLSYTVKIPPQNVAGLRPRLAVGLELLEKK